jgi:GNAT superfamily N-acetyltransferase
MGVRQPFATVIGAMMPSLTVVRAESAHLEQVVPLFDLYRQFYKKTPNLEGARAFLRERLEREESVIFLALLDDTPVGFTQLYPLFSSGSMGRIWLLNDLYVAEAGRKHGVGAALLERARQHGIETGALRLMLQTAFDNFPAQRLYERMGWQRDTVFWVYELGLTN